VLMDSYFTIPLNGLTPGVRDICWGVTGKFFEEFGNEEILDASVDVKASIAKAGSKILIDLYLEGWVSVQCDRCLEEIRMPVDTCAKLTVKFAAEPSSSDLTEREDADDNPDREVLYLPQGEPDIDISQVVYDYVCLSLPLQRHHPDGECNPETAKYLSSESSSSAVNEPSDSNNPFAALKDLFDN